jgi:hypothetical protein
MSSGLGSAAVLALQRLAGNAATASLLYRSRARSPVLDVIGRPGAPLPERVRDEMEARLGHDFSDVRVHTDDAASAAALSIDAAAFTSGRDIAFAAGQFAPDTPTGKATLAHELAHVVQQRRGPVDATPVGGGIALSDPSDRFEREAEHMANEAMAAPVQRKPVDARPSGRPSSERGGVAAIQRRIFESSEVVRQGGGRRAQFGDLLDQLDAYHLAPTISTLSALISACHRWLANAGSVSVLARPLVEQIRADAVEEIRKLGGKPPAPSTGARPASQRVAGGSLAGVADGTQVALAAQTNAPPVMLTIHRGGGVPPSVNHVTPAEFLKVEAAWGMFLSGLGGLQLKPADRADLTYSEQGEISAHTGAPKHPVPRGRGEFDAQSRQLIDRVAIELGRSPTMRSLFVDLVGRRGAPTEQVVRLFLGAGSVGTYDSGADFGVDISHEGWFHEDPVLVGGYWAGITKGELLMHVLEERYYMIYEGDSYPVAHNKCFAPGSFENRYREDRAREKGGVGARTAPTITIDCAAYNAPGHMANDPKQGLAREAELQDFIAIDAVKNVTRAMGIDTKMMFNDMPVPTTALTTITNAPAVVDAYFNDAYGRCLQSALRHHAKLQKLTSSAPVISQTFAENVREELKHFGVIWTMVEGGMPPTISTRAGVSTAAPGANPVAQLQHRWSQDFVWAGLEVAARRQALLDESARIRADLAQMGTDAAVMGDSGNAFLLDQRRQRDALTAINDAQRHRDENCAAVTIGAIHLKSSGEILMDYRDLTHAAASANQSQPPRPQRNTPQYREQYDQQDPETWLKAVKPNARIRQDTAEELKKYESEKGDAIWNGLRTLLSRLATDRSGDRALGGGAVWSVEQFKEPNLPGGIGYDPAQGAVPVAQLLQRMKSNSYPNGTQFVLWVYAPEPDQMSHYLYAEKLDGRVLIEDYQATKFTKGFGARPAKKDLQYAAIDALPPKPLAPFTPDYFTHGCFYALKPQFP